MLGTGTLYLRVDQMNGCIELLSFFYTGLLPPVMHPEIVSGMGIASKFPFGTESSLSNNDMMQFLMEQVIE